MTEEGARAEARAALEQFGQVSDAALDIAEAALAFARIDHPAPVLGPARAHLAALADAARTLGPCWRAEDRAAALRGLLCDSHGYTGDRDSYEDAANANLLRVIERRRGLPVALGVVWLHAASAAGFEAWGIDFPGHFLLAVAGAGDDAVVVDVFDTGTIRSRDDLAALLRGVPGREATLNPEHLRRMTRREVLLRLQNNLRIRRAAAGDLAGALAAAEDMLRLAPDTAPLWREAALLAERAGQPRGAILAWERMRGFGSAEAEDALARLRRRLN